jgi:hypothetical protein
MNRVLMMLISGSSIIFGIAKYEEKIPTILADVHHSKKTKWLAAILITAFRGKINKCSTPIMIWLKGNASPCARSSIITPDVEQTL